jgi:hypothetical protein
MIILCDDCPRLLRRFWNASPATRSFFWFDIIDHIMEVHL